VREEESLTVSQLNNRIRDVINMGLSETIWVCGEIQGYNRNKDRSHVFFELCEKDPVAKTIIARVGLVIFANRKTYIQDVLKCAENAFELKDDIEVKFLCKVDFYPPHGAIRLLVEGIDPVYTLGKIAQDRQRLIAKLKKEGVLEKNKGLPLPLVPLRIGLITAYDSAAYNDFMSELQLSGWGFQVYFMKALMQGKGTEADVCRALKKLDILDAVEVIVITRGGGSIAELSCFDSEPIAVTISQCVKPVISGIGHEINVTVTDLAAHTFQKTPTATAQFLTERVGDFLTNLTELGGGLVRSAQGRLDKENKRLKNGAVQLQSRTHHYLKEHHQVVSRFMEMLRRLPRKLLRDERLAGDRTRDMLTSALRKRLKDAVTRIRHIERVIEIAHPVNTIRRGFSITRVQDGKILRSVAQLNEGAAIRTQVADGVLDSQVTQVIKEEQSEGCQIQSSR
jgi:exodeoxyribonuclease VII large subunit